ncbi:MAG: cysteine dioxygenase, partial [Actinobacteria bacterium]|nr:cysteine dioxygenase [Actinomycetota bacterium]
MTERHLATIAAGWARSLRHERAPDLPAGERAYEQVLCCDTYDAWVIHWGAGSWIEPHDHASSAGALHVVRGEL